MNGILSEERAFCVFHSFFYEIYKSVNDNETVTMNGNYLFFRLNPPSLQLLLDLTEKSICSSRSGSLIVNRIAGPEHVHLRMFQMTASLKLKYNNKILNETHISRGGHHH